MQLSLAFSHMRIVLGSAFFRRSEFSSGEKNRSVFQCSNNKERYLGEIPWELPLFPRTLSTAILRPVFKCKNKVPGMASTSIRQKWHPQVHEVMPDRSLFF